MHILISRLGAVSVALVIGLVSRAQAVDGSHDPGRWAGRQVQFAVVAGDITGAGVADQWLLRGVAFDLEKRLGRLPNLEAADRLEVATAARAASPDTEQAKVAAIGNRIKPDFIVCLSASLSPTVLDVVAHVWTNPQNPDATLSAHGDPSRLFLLIDDLTEKIVSHLATKGIGLGTVSPSSAVHLRPARSVNTYRLVINGMTSLQGGHPAAARSDLVKALQAEPDNWWAHYFLGAVEFHEGRFKESAEHCREAISINPDLYAGVYANLSYCYQGLGDSEQAKWAQDEFRRRTGKTLPLRALPATGLSMSYPSNH